MPHGRMAGVSSIPYGILVCHSAVATAGAMNRRFGPILLCVCASLWCRDLGKVYGPACTSWIGDFVARGVV